MKRAPEGSRGHHTEAGAERLAPPASRPALRATCHPPPRYVSFPPPPRLHLHRSLSRFDLRAHVGRPRLYIQPCTPSLEPS
jgi:hypothetical protein